MGRFTSLPVQSLKLDARRLRVMEMIFRKGANGSVLTETFSIYGYRKTFPFFVPEPPLRLMKVLRADINSKELVLRNYMLQELSIDE